MATANPEMEALPRGIEADNQAIGPWLSNVFEFKQALEVRGGFGQEWQADSTLTLRDPRLGGRGAQDFGYTKVLGTYAMRTAFGHVQVCTVLAGIGYTGDGWNGTISGTESIVGRSGAQTYLALSVRDTTTNETQEYLLHRHTCENSAEASSPQDWRGLWQGYNVKDFAAVYRGSNQRVWFCEFRDTLLFGSPEAGTWCYRPTSTQGLRRQWVQTHAFADSVAGYSESSVVWPVVGGDGAYSLEYAYLPRASWPTFVDACVIGNRVAYADQFNVYFSDPGDPTSIVALNIVPSGSDRRITAIAALMGQVLIFTSTETYSFQPADGLVVSGGRKLKLSDSIGCLGPQAKVKAEESLVWVDGHGVRRTAGNFQLETITGGIEPLFSDQLQNPLTYWFQTQLAGYVPDDVARIRNTYDWRQTDDVCMAYEQVLGLLFILVPAYNVAFVKQDGGWKVWTWDTLVTALSREATVTRNVQAQAIACMDGDVWLAHGIDVMTPADEAKTGGTVPRDENQAYGSYALLQWQRGGALDRSVESTEDGRQGGGWYVAGTTARGDGAVYLGEPVAVPAGYTLPQGSVMPDGGWLYPVVLRAASANTATPPDTVRITVNYDDSNWTPVQFGMGTEIDLLFPPGRAASHKGWGYTAPLAGFREVQVYGNQIRMFFLGTGLAPGSWSSQPYLNVPVLADTVLFWLPFAPVMPQATTMSLGIEFPSAPVMTNGVNPATELTGFWYEQPSALPLQTSDYPAQAVDWAIKTAQLGLDSQTQTRARGLFIRAMGRGAASATVVTGWIYSQLNALVSSDWKDWSAQIADYPADLPSQENSEQPRVPGLRARMYDAIGDAMAARTFNNKATWGNSGAPSTGNFLVDDPQMDTLAVSSGVKGEHVSWMIFGNMLNRAEALSVSALRAILQPRGQRRRTGRQ